MQKERKEEILLTDKIVGDNLKRLRIELGLTRAEIAKAVGVSIQQIQKYENNTNRISSGKLYNIANLLKIPLEIFFRDKQ